MRVGEVKTLICANAGGRKQLQNLKWVHPTSEPGLLVFQKPSHWPRAYPAALSVRHVTHDVVTLPGRIMPSASQTKTPTLRHLGSIVKHHRDGIQNQIHLTPKSKCFPTRHHQPKRTKFRIQGVVYGIGQGLSSGPREG